MTTPLSERELQILRLVAEGFSNRQIAGMLDISENTVKVHVRKIFVKIQVASRTEASMYAVRHGLLVIDQPEPAVEPVQETKASQLPSRWEHMRLIVVLIVSGVLLGGVGWWWSARNSYAVRPIERGIEIQRWNTLTPLPERTRGVQLVTVSGQLYAIGGGLARTILQYDASQNNWLEVGNTPTMLRDGISWSDGTRAWFVDGMQQQLWAWDGRLWSDLGDIPDGVQPADMVRVAGDIVLLDTINEQLWVWETAWMAYELPSAVFYEPQIVVINDVLYMLGDERRVWRSLDQGRTWQIDGELAREWRGGQAFAVLDAIMMFRENQQSVYTVAVGEGDAQAIPADIRTSTTLTVWQTLIIMGSADGQVIDTYQFMYQSFMPMMQ